MRNLAVRVKPGSSRSDLQLQDDGSWIAWLRSSPVDGKANAELIALVAAHFCVRKADVVLKTGAAGRTKRLQIPD